MRGGACGVNWRRPASRSRALRARRWLTSRAWQSSSRMQRTACLRLHVLSGLLEQLREADMRISSYDRQIRALAEASEPARRLMRVESIGPQPRRHWWPLWVTRMSSRTDEALLLGWGVLRGRSSPMGQSIDPQVRRPPWPDVGQAPLTRSRHRGGTTPPELPERTS